ncbi:recombinase family protein [Taibaiella koreensis]|uniref:recombinase family protein n=1 Tax=Taibaiella koreensis TaxID=1268548 RepID=UPI000E59DF50|nr:recombinase family protein [Taibaiella koreensis]
MKTAYLYIRVSTDEQAIKGYSQRSQLDRLTRYCIVRDVSIWDTIFEDYSAKTFNRPGWLAMMARIRRNKRSRPNLILFTKWDRFSRNAGDAYYMITQLRNLDIQPQAIDQELDFAVPENKIILGVYLATSEAENDRRSLNVKQGIHKAKKEGR